MTELYESFAKYNQLMNRRVYAGTDRLSDEDKVADKGAFFKSVYLTLEHIFLADLIWLRRFESVAQLQPVLEPLSLYPEIKINSDGLFKSFTELRENRNKLDSLICDFAASLDNKVLASDFLYKNMAGKNFENKLWICVSHFFNHQTHHRGQATTLLTQMGVDVGVTDFVAVIKE